MTTEEMIEELAFCHINGQGSGQIARIQAKLRAAEELAALVDQLFLPPVVERALKNYRAAGGG